ncbi:hypothetical protein RIR_jg16464.t1 [Rhizophagus irregularis DAOM 181602=DAOM 197198]|uniref:Uncharacterized protein n=1 Tax=Rhizophagus irregularis (strain DAOM 181602 / DAOM 197198 / MUCL 43194) TaxID=747089 RepID=U9U279_RHIID|nr:hypothetical protein RIR_jg16464.t1 [Rhizophagus irregularis DAOM 181602=DAOM 197198]
MDIRSGEISTHLLLALRISSGPALCNSARGRYDDEIGQILILMSLIARTQQIRALDVAFDGFDGRSGRYDS